jgi:hypothetical protein
MARRPRTLRLVSPFMSGPDVVRVQRALAVPDDGEYGPVTASAAAAWKLASGYPDDLVDNTVTPRDRRRLLTLEALPKDYAARAAERAPALERSRLVPAAATAEMEAWAAAGLRERPAGSDRVPTLVRLGQELGLAAWVSEMGYPWCAYAVFLAALGAGGRTADDGLRRGLFNALYVPSLLAEAQAGRFGLRVVARSQAERGDLGLFDWGPGGEPADHVGRLVEPPASRRVVTVDGNTESLVAVRERPLALVRAFVRDS